MSIFPHRGDPSPETRGGLEQKHASIGKASSGVRGRCGKRRNRGGPGFLVEQAGRLFLPEENRRAACSTARRAPPAPRCRAVREKWIFHIRYSGCLVDT